MLFVFVFSNFSDASSDVDVQLLSRAATGASEAPRQQSPRQSGRKGPTGGVGGWRKDTPIEIMAGTLRRLLFGDAESRDIAESLRERRRSGHLARCLKVEEHPGDLAHKVLCSMVLSEAVYKQSDEEVERFIQLTNGLLPWSLPRNKLTSLQFSCEWAMQRCLVTESGGGLFVCFRGTKVQRDFLTDLNVFFDPVFDSYHEEGEDANTPKFVSKSETPCAHRGFLFRAKAVPILWFYRVAKRRGLKLVFTGHSLGGAVASLATIRLLHWLEGEGKTWHQTNVSCVSFAAPAVGNLALQKYVSSRGWDALLYNYTLKEDFVPILMQPQKLLRWKTTKAAKPSAAAEEAGSGPSASASGSSGEEDGDGGGAAKQAEGSGRGYALQAIKFAVRLRRMVPIVNGSRSGSARGANANTFAYVGRQLTVLDDVVVPAALKNETLREYKELSTDSPEGPARDAESSKRWNLVRWAVQSFEAHRMYSYRDRILAACKIFPKVPDSSQRVALGDGVLPEVELNFGTARLCKPLDTSRRGASSASVHITLAGRNLLSCKDFQVEIQGECERERERERGHSGNVALVPHFFFFHTRRVADLYSVALSPFPHCGDDDDDDDDDRPAHEGGEVLLLQALQQEGEHVEQDEAPA